MIYIFGYGIQGRSHALNLRDSGHNVQIINRNDSYFNDAISDGFKVSNTFDSKQLKNGDIIYVLLPEEVHEQMLNDYLGGVEAEITIVFAHGYTLAHRNFDFPSQADLLMIAPRFPGAQVRDYYCDGSGVPAYISVFKDKSGKAHDNLNMLCVDLGFSKGGTFTLAAEHETLVDLAIENIMAPSFFVFVQTLFEKLVEKGVPPEVACMELYYSGETGAVRTAMSRFGLYEGLKKNASPTCQFGVSSSCQILAEETWADNFVEKQLARIQSGDFVCELQDQDRADEIRRQFFSTSIARSIRDAEQKSDAIFRKLP